MVLPPFVPQQPRVRTQGLPSSLNRFACGTSGTLMFDGPPARNTSQAQVANRNSTSIHGWASSNRRNPGGPAMETTNHSFNDSSHNEATQKISIDLTASQHKRQEWTTEVVKLKPQKHQCHSKSLQTKALSMKEETKTAATEKPFGNFRKRRPTGKNADKVSSKNQELLFDRIERLEAKLSQQAKSYPATIIARGDQSHGKAKASSGIYISSTNRKGKRVRFQLTEADSDATICTMDSTISTLSSLKSKRSTVSKRSADISNHRCPRSTKPIKDKKLTNKIFWTPNKLQEMRNSATKRVEKFRAKHPATVRQVDQLFEKFCSINNKKDEQDYDEEDEEKEEMLRAFLEDWAAFGLRGLEEDVTDRKMFQEDRHMAIGSVLTYQERLRAQERSERMFSLYSSNPEEESAAFEHRAELLRNRSESTSHRARMFAMYMALGDALFVANEDQSSTF